MKSCPKRWVGGRSRVACADPFIIPFRSATEADNAQCGGLDIVLKGSSSHRWTHATFRLLHYGGLVWCGAPKRNARRCDLDSLWSEYVDESPKTVSPFSRSEATQFVRELLEAQVSEGHRTLVCFDFAYAFPRDFSAALQVATGKPDNVSAVAFSLAVSARSDTR